MAGAAWPLAALALLLALAGAGGAAPACTRSPPGPPLQPAQLAPDQLLELAAPAVRYLRAFTTQCWLPDQSAPIAMFDNSWAVALVTIWSDLTGPSNGLGRLVTAMQLQTEAALMIANKRPADALSVLELAVLFTLYPVHHDHDALAAWHQSLASNSTIFAARRLSLARTLTLMTRAQAAVGATNSNVDALEAAMVAGQVAGELLSMTDASITAEADLELCTAPDALPAPRRETMEAGSRKDIEALLADVARSTAKALRGAKRAELERLLDKRGLKCRWKCNKRSALLRTLVPALRVPLRLVALDGEEGSSVEVPTDLHSQLPPAWLVHKGASTVERLSGAFAQVIATLQQPLLSDVGIKCTNREGLQQLHRCRDQAARQFGAWSGGPAAPSRDMAALLGHVMQVEEALWRLDQVLEHAMTGVRLGDGTTWVKNRGYTWVLGKYMADKLYPQGQGAPVYYQTRRPAEPHVGSTICLDKTYLLDTVLRLDVEGLRGLQYALDNLQYAQSNAGGPEAFWRLLAQDSPTCRGAACATGNDPISQLVPTQAGEPAPAPPRPVMVDFRFMSEQQLQANLAAATDPSHRVQDPFVAAFVSLCVVSCASLYLYSHRGRLARVLTPQRARGASAAAAVSAVAQRNAATATLRDALAGDSLQKLHAAIDAAEATGVEKPLVKKARAALQALKKRKQHLPGGVAGAGGSGGAGAGAGAALHRPPAAPPQPQQHQQQQPLRQGSSSTPAAQHAALISGLPSAASDLSASASSGLSQAPSEQPGMLAVSASGSWVEQVGGEGPQREGAEGGPHSMSAAAPLPGTQPPLTAASTPKPVHVALYPSEPELPTSPGTPAESLARSSPGDGSAGLLGSASCTPLPSPGFGPCLSVSGELYGGAAAPVAPLPASSRPGASSSPGSAQSYPPSALPTPSLPSTTAKAAPGAPGGSRPGSAASAGGEQPGAAHQHRQLTPRQQKKLLRLQQKHAAAAAAAVSMSPCGSGDTSASATASEETDPSAAPTASPSPSQHAPPSPGRASRQGAQSEDEQEQAAQLTEQQLKALAAREESAPSKQPRSAKKKARQAAAAAGHPAGSSSGSELGPGPASRDGSRHGGHAYGAGEQRGVLRTLSDPLREGGGRGTLSPLRQGGTRLDPRTRHMMGYPATAYWQAAGSASAPSLSDTPLNANAPEFSPSGLHGVPPPGSRLGSPGYGGAPAAGPSGLPHTPSLPFSPSPSSLLGLSCLSSGASSLEAQRAAPLLAGPGPTPALQQHHGLLAQLQQIWGEQPVGGGGEAGEEPLGGGGPPTTAALPGFGGAGGVLGGAPSEQQQQQQLAALLFVQHLGLQQHLAGRPGSGPPGGAGGQRAFGGADSLPLSPQQLPPASADMLREVLGSPLSLLPRCASPTGSGGWPGGEGGRVSDMRPSLSLTRELAAAQVQALRTLGELPEEPHTVPVGSPGGSGGRATAARSLAAAVHSAALRGAAHAAQPPFQPAPASAPVPGQAEGKELDRRIDSLDLEALGFTESGE